MIKMVLVVAMDVMVVMITIIMVDMVIMVIRTDRTTRTDRTDRADKSEKTDLTFKLDFSGNLCRAAFAILAKFMFLSTSLLYTFIKSFTLIILLIGKCAQ